MRTFRAGHAVSLDIDIGLPRFNFTSLNWPRRCPLLSALRTRVRPRGRSEKCLDEPTNLARRIAAAVGEPFVIDGVTAEFGVGIGIAVASNDGTVPEELVRRADRALYRAKAAGRSSVCFFESERDARVERRIQIERELRSAIAAGAIVPHYQPLVSLDGGNRIVGFEVLARWQSENLGYIGPDVFIPIAEEIGLMPHWHI